MTTIEEAKLKDLIKSALIEVLESRSDLLQKAAEEAVEDFVLSKAIEQGLRTDVVSREDVFAIL